MLVWFFPTSVFGVGIFFLIAPFPDLCLLVPFYYFQLCPYPSDDELQQGLQVSVDWQDFRRNELSSTMNAVKGKKLMRDVIMGGPTLQDSC